MNEEKPKITHSERAPCPPDVRPRKSRHGRAASQGRDRNRQAKGRVMNQIRYGNGIPMGAK